MVGHIIGKKVLDIIYRSDYTSLAVTILIPTKQSSRILLTLSRHIIQRIRGSLQLRLKSFLKRLS